MVWLYNNRKPVETKEQALEIVANMYKGEREFLRKIHREGVEVHSCFWDSSLNSIIKIEPGELPEPKRIVRKKKSSE